MRLCVVHDKNGRILAASDLDTEGPIARPAPVEPEHTAIEVEVPSEYAKNNLMEICQRLRVDVERKQLVALDAGD